MNERTEETRRVSEIHVDPCPVFPDWCEEPKPGHLEHFGRPDMSAPVCATAEPLDLEDTGAGVLAPQVIVDVAANHHDHPGEAPSVGLTIYRPDKQAELDVHMTVDEAEFLRRHLVQALRMLGRDVP